LHLVTTIRHIDLALPIIPEWWGIILYEDKDKISVIRNSERNINTDFLSIIHMLTLAELRYLCLEMKITFLLKHRRVEIVDRIFKSSEESDTRRVIRAIFRKRIKESYSVSSPIP
jgi:hypothetical protein